MPLGSSNRTALYWKAQSARGTAATGTFETARLTGQMLKHEKETVKSREIRADRQTSYVAEVRAGAAGAVPFELSYGAFDSWLESLLASTWVTPAAGHRQTISCTFATASDTISGTGIHLSIVPGQYVRIDGASNAANNGFHLVTAVATGVLTVATNLGNEGPVSVGVSASRLTNGITPKFFTLEEAFEDLTTPEYMIYEDALVGSMSLSIVEGSVISGSFDWLAREGASGTSAAKSGANAAPTNSIINATSNVGRLSEGYGLATRAAFTKAIRSIQLTINGNVNPQRAIANRVKVGDNFGTFMIDATIDSYFEDGVLLRKAIAHTPTSLVIPMHTGAVGATYPSAAQIAGETIIITIPRCFVTGSPEVPGLNDDVRLSLALEAARDPETGWMVQIDRFAAVS